MIFNKSFKFAKKKGPTAQMFPVCGLFLKICTFFEELDSLSHGESAGTPVTSNFWDFNSIKFTLISPKFSWI